MMTEPFTHCWMFNPFPHEAPETLLATPHAVGTQNEPCFLVAASQRPASLYTAQGRVQKNKALG